MAAGCAVAAPPAATAVVGGTPTTAKRWPWQVAITTRSDGDQRDAHGRYVCSGALVAPAVVVTAGHCLYLGAGLQSASRFAVVSGRTQLSSHAGREIPVRDYRFLTDRDGASLFDYGARRFDVALLRLASPAVGVPIKVAGPAERGLWSPGRTAYVAGWGRLGPSGPFPDVLHSARLRIVSDSACARRWYPGEFFSDSMLCASAERRGACSRDSGGPLVVPGAGGRFRLVGDVSWSMPPCGTRPGVYGRLAGGPVRERLLSAIRQLTVPTRAADG